MTLSQWPASKSVTAQAGGDPPVIHSVDPKIPQCVLLNSPHLHERTLTITGENFGTIEDSTLQFRQGGERFVTIHFGSEVNWESSTRITLDMASIRQHLWDYTTLSLHVRISSDTYSAQAFWSAEFYVAVDASHCPGKRATTAPTSPTPSSATSATFPPSPPERGVAGDLWADVVVGKMDFSQVGENRVVPFKVFNPGGVVVDRSVEPGRAYVWDSANSRILGIALAACYEGASPCSADVVIGQPSGYDHSACNGDSGVQSFPMRPVATAETLCGIPDIALTPSETHTFVTMAVDSHGNLYVPDSINHRILKYESPFGGDSVADGVWGQADFSGMACNRGALRDPTAETLCFHSPTNKFLTNLYGNGVEIDGDGNMWVADGGNNRVLRFPADAESGEIAGTADLVLGQPDFHSTEPGDAFNRLHGPSAVRSGDGGWMYVADTINDRVLVFKPPLESGMQAETEFGSGFHRPTSLEIDPLGRGVWVVDAGNYMVELWDVAGASVVQVLGRDSYQPDGKCGERLSRLPGAPYMCPIAGSLGLDRRGNVLVPVFLDTADVFRFPATMSRGVRGAVGPADRRLFYPLANPNFKDIGGMHSARGVAVWQDQLIVSDIGRLMFWNELDTLYSGRPADGVVGDESHVEELTQCCGRIKVDASGRLWVLGFEGNGMLDVYELPLTERSVPVHTIWTREEEFPVLGTGDRITLGRRVFGIAPDDAGDLLWLSDTDNHRVLRIRHPLTSPVVDVVLGQGDASGNLCNQGRFQAADRMAIREREHGDVLCSPGALSIDRMGNLYVSDHGLEVEGNRRLLVFSPESTPRTSSQAIFAPHPVKVFVRSARTPSTLWTRWFPGWEGRAVVGESRHVLSAATWEPTFDSTNRMVVGYNAYAGPRFVGVYDDPLGPETLPTSYLYDFGSMHYAATFDDNDNLYVGDINRARVLVYLNPFNNTQGPAEKRSPEPRPRDAAGGPKYAATIQAVSPEPPFCVVRDSRHAYEARLELTVDGLPGQNFTLELRRVGRLHREVIEIPPGFIQNNRSHITVAGRSTWGRLWPNVDKVTLTARVLDHGKPVSNWSPSFLLAEDVESCGIALPTPTPTPEPTPTHTPTPEPTPTLTPSPTPEPTPTPTPTPEPTPTHTPSPEPTPTHTPSPEPTPTHTPSPEPTPTHTPSPEPTPTHTPSPEPTSTHTPSPEPTLTHTPSPEPTPTHTPTPEPTQTYRPTPEPTPTLTPVPARDTTRSLAPTVAGAAKEQEPPSPDRRSTPSSGVCSFTGSGHQAGGDIGLAMLLLVPASLVGWKVRRRSPRS